MFFLTSLKTIPAGVSSHHTYFSYIKLLIISRCACHSLLFSGRLLGNLDTILSLLFIKVFIYLKSNYSIEYDMVEFDVEEVIFFIVLNVRSSNSVLADFPNTMRNIRGGGGGGRQAWAMRACKYFPYNFAVDMFGDNGLH